MCEECGSTAHKTEDIVACQKTAKCTLCGMCLEWHTRSSKRHGFSIRNQNWEEKYKKVMRALESLTPSGSEFVDDPERCVAFVKSYRETMMNVIRQTKIELNELKEKLAAGIAAREN